MARSLGNDLERRLPVVGRVRQGASVFNPGPWAGGTPVQKKWPSIAVRPR
jgi:hypothetical protein